MEGLFEVVLWFIFVFPGAVIRIVSKEGWRGLKSIFGIDNKILEDHYTNFFVATIFWSMMGIVVYCGYLFYIEFR